MSKGMDSKKSEKKKPEKTLKEKRAAKTEKNWALSDKIRDELTAIGIRVKDRKDGCDWEIE